MLTWDFIVFIWDFTLAVFLVKMTDLQFVLNFFVLLIIGLNVIDQLVIFQLAQILYFFLEHFEVYSPL